MIQYQIEQFTRSLQNIATEYSDPAVLLQQMPVLRDFPVLQQNPEYLGYGAGGLIGLFLLKRIWSKRQKRMIKNVAMVMPQPYVGEADHPKTSEIAPASFDKDDLHAKVAQVQAEKKHAKDEEIASALRSPEQQQEDVAAVRFKSRPALTPDEARIRAITQSVLKDFGPGYLLMARCALSALLQPNAQAVGEKRAQAIRAIEDKYVEFGIFDRAGRLVLALDVAPTSAPFGKQAQAREIVKRALCQADISIVTLSPTDSPAQIHKKCAPYLQAGIAKAEPARSETASKHRVRPGRPTRPKRPLRPTHEHAIAAE